MDYQVEKHGGALKVARGNANWLLAEDDKVDQLVRELSAKIAPDRVRVYKVEPVDVEVEQSTREILMEFNTPKSTVEALLVGFVMQKRKGQLQPGATGASKTYSVLTNKGRAEIRVILTGTGPKCKLTMQISGVKETVDFLAASLEKELSLFQKGTGG